MESEWRGISNRTALPANALTDCFPGGRKIGGTHPVARTGKRN
jgi:hypothetical protein